jgi:hypothetical protein
MSVTEFLEVGDVVHIAHPFSLLFFRSVFGAQCCLCVSEFLIATPYPPPPSRLVFFCFYFLSLTFIYTYIMFSKVHNPINEIRT